MQPQDCVTKMEEYEIRTISCRVRRDVLIGPCYRRRRVSRACSPLCLLEKQWGRLWPAGMGHWNVGTSLRPWHALSYLETSPLVRLKVVCPDSAPCKSFRHYPSGRVLAASNFRLIIFVLFSTIRGRPMDNAFWNWERCPKSVRILEKALLTSTAL